jgi:fructose-1,6-bisphosphatase/inositol monophosphatase family enzyme
MGRIRPLSQAGARSVRFARMRDLDLAAVGDLIREVARAELLPRFRHLRPEDVHAKPSADDANDVVTAADLAMERILGPLLEALVPGSVLIGEEAVAARAGVVDRLEGGEPAWLIDPLDGTRNFAAGRETFGVLITLCQGGDARAAWIHLPTVDRMLIAEAGAGAFEGERRLGAPPPASSSGLPVGTIHTRFMTPELRVQVEARAADTTVAAESTHCAAWEYTALVDGTHDFILYYRLLPWDHAAGALVITEAGGAIRQRDGRPYRAATKEPLALVTARASDWSRLAETLLGPSAAIQD